MLFRHTKSSDFRRFKRINYALDYQNLIKHKDSDYASNMMLLPQDFISLSLLLFLRSTRFSLTNRPTKYACGNANNVPDWREY